MMYFLGKLGKADILSGSARVPAQLAHAMIGAEAVVNSARFEADDVRRAAHDAGYKEGKEQAQAEIAELLLNAHKKAARHVTEMQPILVDCVLHVMRSMLDDADPEALILRSVERVRDRLGETEGLLLRVPPRVVTHAEDAARRLMEKYGAAPPIRVAADYELDWYDWIIESPLGRAEVRRDWQLEQLAALLRKAIAETEQTEQTEQQA